MRRHLCLLNLTTPAVLVLTTLVVAAAQAQNFGGRGGRGPGGPGAGFRLLQAEPVQKELNLTEEQKGEITKLNEELQDLSPQERRDKMGETRQKVEAILQPEQKERLEQIGLQLLGGRALTRPEVAKKLGLSEEQRDQLDELFPPGGGIGTPSAPPSNNDPAAKVGSAKAADTKAGKGNTPPSPEELSKKALDVLTADQKSQFEQMQGKKIEFDPSQVRGGGGGGGGGGRGRGQGGGAKGA